MKNIIPTMCSFLILIGVIMFSHRGHRASAQNEIDPVYLTLDAHYTNALNTISTATDAEREDHHGTRKYPIEFKHGLDSVRPHIYPLARQYIDDREEYLKHGSPANLYGMRYAVAELEKLSDAVQQIVTTNLTVKGL